MKLGKRGQLHFAVGIILYLKQSCEFVGIRERSCELKGVIYILSDQGREDEGLFKMTLQPMKNTDKKALPLPSNGIKVKSMLPSNFTPNLISKRNIYSAIDAP